jgi:putative ABC transport system permease protein
MMGFLAQDLRYALRALLRAPSFSLVAVLTLALGIGANSAMFSVVNAVLLTPLPFKVPKNLVIVWERNGPRHRDQNVVSPANYLDWKDRATSFSDFAAFTWTGMTLTGESPERVSGRAVTANFFRTLGMEPLLGRGFTAEEDAPGGPRVIVLSYGLWQRRFAGDSSIIGRAIPIAGGNALVVGVMPAAFQSMPYGDDSFWQPLGLDASDRNRRGRYAMTIARLKEGVRVSQAQAEMETISRALERDYPDFNTGWTTNVVTLTDQIVGSSRTALLVLMGAVGFVLLIACANVGNLMLGRAASRERELAVRAAMGASRWRLVQQSLAEGVLLSLAGAALGVLFAVWGVDLLVLARPQAVPRLAEIALDGRVLALTLGVSLVVGVAVGLPAILSGRLRSNMAGLRGDTGRTTSGRAATRLRGGLVIAQMTFALMLLVGAGLMVRSLQRLTSVDPGFDPSHLLTMGVELPSATYAEGSRQSALFSDLLERLRALPGVQSAGVVDFLPMIGPGSATSIRIVGRPEPAVGQAPSADIRIASASYFTTMRIPLMRGRGFTPADLPRAPGVVLINETAARQIWPGEDPVGQRVKVSMWSPDTAVQIVGVVGDVRHSGLDGDIRPMVYYPTSQIPMGSGTLVLRATGAPAALSAMMRSTLRELDPELPAGEVATMETYLARSMADRRFPMILLTAFAAIAVALAGIGIYSVLSYAVSQRTREIGVRLALGAGPADVLGMVLRAGLSLILAGVLLGALGGAIAARALRSLLFEVVPTDPVTFAVVTALLVAIALLATYLPARRAVRVDPMVALRAE